MMRLTSVLFSLQLLSHILFKPSYHQRVKRQELTGLEFLLSCRIVVFLVAMQISRSLISLNIEIIHVIGGPQFKRYGNRESFLPL